MQKSLEKRLLALEFKQREFIKRKKIGDLNTRRAIPSMLNYLFPLGAPRTMDDVDWDNIEPASDEELAKVLMLQPDDDSAKLEREEYL